MVVVTGLMTSVLMQHHIMSLIVDSVERLNYVTIISEICYLISHANLMYSWYKMFKLKYKVNLSVLAVWWITIEPTIQLPGLQTSYRTRIIIPN